MQTHAHTPQSGRSRYDLLNEEYNLDDHQHSPIWPYNQLLEAIFGFVPLETNFVVFGSN